MTSTELVAAVEASNLLVLSADVTNPAPDRRATRDWRCSPVIPKGTKFYLQRDFDTKSICLYKAGGYAHVGVHYRTDGTLLDRSAQLGLSAALLPNLAIGEPARTLGSVAAKHYVDVDTASIIVVRRLLKAGKLTLDEVETALAADAGEE